ncbi:DsbA family protein [Streptomyces sp. NPDC058251]|uniref:DsbA family protein n=2 Tax=Streptomyces TaxID=1883 RepID=UPI0036ECE950
MNLPRSRRDCRPLMGLSRAHKRWQLSLAVATSVALITSCSSTASPRSDASSQVSGLLGGLTTISKDGSTLVVGDLKARNAVRIYEDPRCPFCARFEKAAGPVLSQLASEGTLKIEYVIASFLDLRLGGTGSAEAANAMRAAVDAGKFPEYHQALFRHQMNEVVDGYKPSFLIQIASTVPGLRSPGFDRAVRHMTYRTWVDRAQLNYQSHAHGTPSVLINGQAITVDAEHGMYEPDGVAMALRRAGVH